MSWQRLCFIQYQNAIGELVQMAAVCRLGRKQRLEKTNACRYNTRRIPALTQQSGPFIQLCVAVNLQQIRHNFLIILHILLDNRQKWQN